MRKKTFNRIITAGLTIISLFLVFTFSVDASNGSVTRYYTDDGYNMYNEISVTITQYLDTADEGAFNGLTVSKTFSSLDGYVIYDNAYDDYRWMLQAFKDDWYYDEHAGYYNSGGYFDVSVNLPFKSESGELFDVSKLNDSAYLTHMMLGFNCYLPYITQRNFIAKLYLTNGSELLLSQDSINDISNGYYTINTDTFIKPSEIGYFNFTFRYYGLPQDWVTFDFTLVGDSYLEVTDYSNYGDSSLSDSKDKLTQLQNAMNQPAPDIGSALGNIKSEDMALTGSFLSDSKRGVFYTFLTSLMVVGVSLGLVGYVLHGKK